MDLLAILDALPAHLAVVDRDGNIRMVNKAWQDFAREIGLDGLKGIGTSLLDVYAKAAASSPQSSRTIGDGLRSVLDGTTPSLAHDQAFQTPNGIRWLRIRANPMGTDRVNGAVVMHLDITEQMAAAEAMALSEEHVKLAQRMESVGRLAGGLAHDFNNILAAITGCADLALTYVGTDDPLRDDLEAIKDASFRATTLTRQLLAFSRQQVLQPKVVDLNVIVEGMTIMLRRLIGEDVDLITDLPKDLHAVRADPGQIEQVIMNLAVNSRDAMPRGGTLVIATSNVHLDDAYVSQHPVVAAGDYVRLTVSDNGAGMPPEVQARIFDPFYTTKGPAQGTGLGLSTVYGIVKQSDGYVWVYSEPGKGTTFRIYLPQIHEAPASIEQPPEQEAAPRGTETVLLVEDEPLVRSVASRILRLHGYKVLEADSGERAIEISFEHKETIHMLLTDVVMPHMSGRHVARELVTRLPDLKVLYMSGFAQEAIEQHGVLDPGTAFIEKPFTPGTLARKVREVLDGVPPRG